jgi:hypothetical protein
MGNLRPLGAAGRSAMHAEARLSFRLHGEIHPIKQQVAGYFFGFVNARAVAARARSGYASK